MTCNAAVSACEKGMQWVQALEQLTTGSANGMAQNVIGFNAMILAYTECWQWCAALELWDQMHARGVQPELDSFQPLVAQCKHLGLFGPQQLLLRGVRNTVLHAVRSSTTAATKFPELQ